MSAILMLTDQFGDQIFVGTFKTKELAIEFAECLYGSQEFYSAKYGKSIWTVHCLEKPHHIAAINGDA